MCFINSSIEISLLSIYALIAAATSRILCVGIFVAIPTAIPVVPLQSKNGNFAGRTDGSSQVSSKFLSISTVSLLISSTISSEIFDIFASV